MVNPCFLEKAQLVRTLRSASNWCQIPRKAINATFELPPSRNCGLKYALGALRSPKDSKGLTRLQSCQWRIVDCKQSHLRCLRQPRVADRLHGNAYRLHGQVLRPRNWPTKLLESLVQSQTGPLHQPRPNRLRRRRCESVSVCWKLFAERNGSEWVARAGKSSA